MNRKKQNGNFYQKPVYHPEDGQVVGTHQGHIFSQRPTQRPGSRRTKEPLFVIDTDVEHNIIYTGQGKEHPGLYRGLFVKDEEIHWVREDLRLSEGESMEVMARIRYRQPLEKHVYIKRLPDYMLYLKNHNLR